ncbi:hypothetical protein DLM_1664 [Aquitalea magnusonii]|uniref:Uncharacterized protein n=1 Tax=Aquitalea magnusonii TaxID=332411 RepID=A0A3G9GGA3_9NEIS|nr:hypothetical protein [Aquitalea magnusonii]BBF85281.1 hypothetical protein DLM_1664 [Aquitalea magnusonii]
MTSGISASGSSPFPAGLQAAAQAGGAAARRLDRDADQDNSTTGTAERPLQPLSATIGININTTA